MADKLKDISLRDWFAGMALARLDPTDRYIGEAAYDIADNMLRARELPLKARAVYSRKTPS